MASRVSGVCESPSNASCSHWRRRQAVNNCAEAYPDIEDEDIRQALEYAAANLEDRVEELVPLR